MLSVLIWKEYREQRMVWTALAFLGALLILGLSSMIRAGWVTPTPADWQALLCMLAVMVVGVYALICGAMMLAGERENGTLPYLDALPGFRQRVWLGKLVAALLLVLVQIAFLMALIAAVSLFEDWHEVGLTLLGMTAAGLYGLAWGMLFSSFGRSVLNVILLSLAGHVAWACALGFLAAIVVAVVTTLFGRVQVSDPSLFAAGIFILTVSAALAGSALVFTRLDRRRLQAASGLAQRKRLLHPSWPMLFWLTWRQTRGFAAGIALFALLLGLVVLANRLILWPTATLIVGVLCGATAFADEQQGPFRFLGDQRLPLFRLWLVKVGLRFIIAVVATLIVLGPSFVVTVADFAKTHDNSNAPFHLFAHLFHSVLFVDLIPPGLFLTMWLVYGFSAGCLFGLLFRHGLASGVFALFVCAFTTALWLPSLLLGGLHAWQVFGPPVLILLATPLLMRPWAAGRIASWTTALRLTPFVVLAGLWIAGGLLVRVVEIPDAPVKVDLDAFRASLPKPEQNEGGQLFRSACIRFDDARKALESKQAPQGMAPGGQPAGGAAQAGAAAGMMPPGGAEVPVLSPVQQADEMLEHGWPADDHAPAAWLDKMYAGEWPALLTKAANLPTGPFDDVRNMTLMNAMSLKAAYPARVLALVLAARGLQRQAAGDDEAYVENLRLGLALARSLVDHTPATEVFEGRAVKAILIKGLDRWLEKLQGRPDLLHKALDLLSRGLNETADYEMDQELIEDLLVKNTVDDPVPYLQLALSGEGNLIEEQASQTREEAEWIAMAWFVPWERARRDRILRLMYDADVNQVRWLHMPENGFGLLPQLGPYRPDNRYKPARICKERAMLLKLALRWYQADNGKPAENLDELVPKYLSSIPIDPYDGKPFRYRLSRGEEIAWPEDEAAAPGAAPPPARKIPAGQGILWSVGQEGSDGGGRRQTSSPRGETTAGEDFVFLVPLPPKSPR